MIYAADAENAVNDVLVLHQPIRITQCFTITFLFLCMLLPIVFILNQIKSNQIKVIHS